MCYFSEFKVTVKIHYINALKVTFEMCCFNVLIVTDDISAIIRYIIIR